MNQNLFAIKIATPYATALFNFVNNEFYLYEVTSDLYFLQELLSTSSEFKNFLQESHQNYVPISSIIEGIFEDKLDMITSNFLFWLKIKNRLKFLPIIILLFFEIVYKTANIQTFQVISAKKLSYDQRLNFIKKIQFVTQSNKISIKFFNDPSLIAGFSIRYDGKRIDYNIRDRLDKLVREVSPRLSL